MCVYGGDIIILIHRMDQMFSQLVYVSLPRAGGGRPAQLCTSFSLLLGLRESRDTRSVAFDVDFFIKNSNRVAHKSLSPSFPPADPSSSASHPPLDLNSG